MTSPKDVREAVSAEELSEITAGLETLAFLAEQSKHRFEMPGCSGNFATKLKRLVAHKDTLLSALSRGDGWRLMPTEATPEMLDAGHMADVPWEFEELDGTPVLGPFALEISGPNKPDRAKDIVAYLYRAMIAAAPPVPEGEE